MKISVRYRGWYHTHYPQRQALPPWAYRLHPDVQRRRRNLALALGALIGLLAPLAALLISHL